MTLSKPGPAPIYFLTGSDEAAVKKAAAGLAGKLAPEADVFGLETIDGAVDLVDEAVNRVQETIHALLTLPFLGGSKLVWLKNASFLADTVTGRSEIVVEALAKLCEVLSSGLPRGVTFLLSAPLADKRRTSFKTLSKLASTQVYDLPVVGFRSGGEEVLIEWTTTRVTERNLLLEPEAIEILAARVGLEANQLETELEKLETAFGSAHQVTAQDIRLLVPQTREGEVFDLSRAIEKRNLPLAMETLEYLDHRGESGIGILLAAIVPTIRNLLLAKDLLTRHRLAPPAKPYSMANLLERLPAEATSHLPRKKDGSISSYPLGVAAIHAAHFSLAELKSGFAACAEANQQLLSGSFTDKVILARLLIQLLARKTS